MGKFNNANNGKKNGGNRRSKEEYEARKAAQLEQQGKNLDVIEDIAKYLDTWLKGEKSANRITMKDILTMLNDEKGYSVDETKAVSQYSYMLMELANARNNKYVSADRINIRIMYIEERMKTSLTVPLALSIPTPLCSTGTTRQMLRVITSWEIMKNLTGDQYELHRS